MGPTQRGSHVYSSLIKIADHWRVWVNRRVVSTHRTKREADSAAEKFKKRNENRCGDCGTELTDLGTCPNDHDVTSIFNDRPSEGA